MSERTRRSLAEAAAREIGLALNESHCTGAPIHELTHALLGDASDLGEILDDFAEIVTPIIAEAIAPSAAAEIANLEWRVVEAAVRRRKTEKQLFPTGAPDSGNNTLNTHFILEQIAVDALIAAREAELKEEK